MKLEIIAGTKEQVPMTGNVIVKLDGKPMHPKINFLDFSLDAEDGIAYWRLGMKREPRIVSKLIKLSFKLRRAIWKITKPLRRKKNELQ